MALPTLYRTQDVADYLLIDVDTVVKLIHNRELAAKKVGREWRISEDDLLEYLEAKKIKPRRAS
jgi:excisionase family DNA binding protein